MKKLIYTFAAFQAFTIVYSWMYMVFDVIMVAAGTTRLPPFPNDLYTQTSIFGLVFFLCFYEKFLVVLNFNKPSILRILYQIVALVALVSFFLLGIFSFGEIFCYYTTYWGTEVYLDIQKIRQISDVGLLYSTTLWFAGSFLPKSEADGRIKS